MTDSPAIPGLRHALPYWLSLGLVPILIVAATQGGLALFLPPLATWALFALLDALTGIDPRNADPETPDTRLSAYRVLTMVWVPVQAVTIFGLIAYATNTDHLAIWEKIVLFLDVGIMTGTVGIVYAHELMHQRNHLERWLGDALMTMALYGHFRSEHLLVHHRYVGTPRDAVTARYNEQFWRFFRRVLRQSLISAWEAEKTMLARKGLPAWDRSNPFWRYISLDLGYLILALVIGGWAGVGLFLVQAGFAVFQLELVNYVEHYGLTRKYLGDGRYEPVRPRHSWNAAHRASNWLLINLQRHADHHARPDRRFPLLQTYGPEDAPQLPRGYPAMTLLALIPRLWRKRMNPEVDRWRARFYPEITDWRPYSRMTTPMPR